MIAEMKASIEEQDEHIQCELERFEQILRKKKNQNFNKPPEYYAAPNFLKITNYFRGVLDLVPDAGKLVKLTDEQK